MGELIDQYGGWVVLPIALWLTVNFLGSLVDIYQAAWIYRRVKARAKRRLVAQVKRDLLFEQHTSHPHTHEVSHDE